MSEWTAVSALVTVAGLFLALAAPVVRLNNTITRLVVIVERLERAQSGAEAKNSDAHRRLWEHNTVQDARLSEYEKQLHAAMKSGFSAKTPGF